jgi:hypothetical protein
MEVKRVAEASDRPRRLPRLEPGSVFAGCRIDGVIARGGMGVVYKAKDIDLERVVALKVIAPEHTQDETAVARFKAEARVAASLEHPNIVPIHRGGEHDGVLYLVMRYVPGTNLRDVIDRAPLALPRVGRILTDVARALDVAHARGLVHRDVKPANILLSGEGDSEQVYLTDFGLTKRLGSHGDLTRPGGWVGTPDYVAPEQIQARDVDGRADVYSLGCVLYEMLTGHVAYPKGSDVAKLWAHVADPPPLPSTERSELVAAFDTAVAKATAKDPEDRYRSAGELAAAVRAAIAEQHRADAGRGEWASAGDQARAATRDTGLATRDEVFAGADAPPPGAPPAYDAPPPYEPAAPPPYERAAPPPYDPGPPPAAVSPAAGRYRGSGGEPPGGDGDGDGWLRRRRWPIAGAAALLLVAAAAVVILSSGGSSGTSATKADASSKSTPAGRRSSAALGPVPTNRVSGDGNVVLRLNGDVATITLTTHKLLNGSPHALHIHAGARGQCPVKRAARLHNGNLSIATKSGVPFYGHAVTALTTRGNTDPDRSLLAFKRYPNTGEIRYERKIDVGPVVASYIRKNNAVVVVHGIDYNHNGLYDGTLDRSDLNPSLPGEATAPALCGTLIAAKGSAKGGSSKGNEKTGTGTKTAQASPSGTQVFAAALTAGPGSPDPASVPAWHCVLPSGSTRDAAEAA